MVVKWKECDLCISRWCGGHATTICDKCGQKIYDKIKALRAEAESKPLDVITSHLLSEILKG